MTQVPTWKAKLKGKQLLIFDFDGTVADTSPLHAAAFNQVLAPFGITVDYPSIAGLKTLDAMRACLESVDLHLDSERVSELVMEKQRVVREMITRGLQPLPGVDEFLQWARQHFRLAMVTSGSRGTVRLALKALGYETLFDPLICADDVAAAKPHPEGFLRCLKMTGISADSSLVFEDSNAGFTSARAAGVDSEDARQFFIKG